ncbi:chloride chloride channel family protein, partial [Cystoisospora suis]
MARHCAADREMTRQEYRVTSFLREKRNQRPYHSSVNYERKKRSFLSKIEGEQHDDLQRDMGGCVLPSETHEEGFSHAFQRIYAEEHVDGFKKEDEEEDMLDRFSTSHHHPSHDRPHHSSVYTPYKHGQRGSHSYQRVLRSDSETSSFFHPSTSSRFPSSQPHLSSSSPHAKPRSSRFLKQLKKWVLLRRQGRNRSSGGSTSLSSPSNATTLKSPFSLSMFFSSRKKNLQEAVSIFCANCSKIWRRWSRDPYSSAHAMSVNIVDLYAAYEDVHATPHSLAGRRDSSSSSFSPPKGMREDTPKRDGEEVQPHLQTTQLSARAPLQSDGVHTPHQQLETSDFKERTDRITSQGLSHRSNRKNAENEEEEKVEEGKKYDSSLAGEKLDCSQGIHERKGVSSSSRRRDETGRNIIGRCTSCQLRGEQVYLWLALVLIGILTALVSYFLDWVVDFVFLPLQESLVERHSYTAIFAYSLACGVVAAGCCLLVPQSQGSSIPELKTILSGSLLPNFFSLSTFLARCIGLLSCVCGGLSIGKEGPFVHLSSILAFQLCRLIPVFQFLISSPSRLLSLLDSAVSTGVTATFGTPFGGVLFAVEVTSTFFLVHALWKSYFCCIFCVLTFRLLHETLSPKIEQLLYQGEQLPAFDVSLELCNFAVLGGLCGCLGGLFVWAVSKVLQAARKYAYTTPLRKVVLVCSVILLLNLTSHHATLLKSEDRLKLKEFFDVNHLNEEKWGGPHAVVSSLALFVFFKFTATILSAACPVPAGIFTPIFVCGAALG